MFAQLGLGMAALGRPGYVTLTHATDLGGQLDPAAMESHAREVLDAAFNAGIRYYDMARSYGKAEDFFASWLKDRGLKCGDVTVASKWGYTYTAGWSTRAEQHEVKDHSLATFNRQIGETLSRLDGHLSLYQIHSVTAESKTLDDGALIDAIAGLKAKGIRAGLSTSGAGQSTAIRKAMGIERDGRRVFDSVQATWNLLERGAEAMLVEAHEVGMKVVIKEALANGRLTHANTNHDPVFASAMRQIGEIAAEKATTIEMVALAAALSRPWADYVLSGAATVSQVSANVAALRSEYNEEIEERLRIVAVNSNDYWRARSGFAWN
jgi:aryl-alcohol dehydrogenase-like predicted oxidoreductase